MISMDKIYIVTSEWSTYNGDREFAVIGAFFDLREAVECLERERDTIITESYHFNSLQEARDDEDIVIEEDTDRFYIMSESSLDKWDELRIHEKLVKQRDFFAIQFEYDGETFNERIYLDQIDLTHYDDMWDWWFGSNGNKKFPDLNFELTADKDAEDGSPICNHMYINVYENEDAMEPVKRITNISWVYSQIERKEHHAKG